MEIWIAYGVSAGWRLTSCLWHLSVQGNVILADANYEILTLLRSHRDDDKGLVIMARHAYPIHSIRLHVPLQQEQLAAALEAADAKQSLKGDQIITCLTTLYYPIKVHVGLRHQFSAVISILTSPFSRCRSWTAVTEMMTWIAPPKSLQELPSFVTLPASEVQLSKYRKTLQ